MTFGRVRGGGNTIYCIYRQLLLHTDNPHSAYIHLFDGMRDERCKMSIMMTVTKYAMSIQITIHLIAFTISMQIYLQCKEEDGRRRKKRVICAISNNRLPTADFSTDDTRRQRRRRRHTTTRDDILRSFNIPNANILQWKSTKKTIRKITI